MNRARPSSAASPTPCSSTGCANGHPGTRSSALERFGGNGYVEESGMPRLYREAPLASIWEGSGNVQCLDVLRAMVKDPTSVEAFSPRSRRVRAPNRSWTRMRPSCEPRSPVTSRRSSRGRGESSKRWRSPCRPLCWFATATRPWPTPSAPHASPATGAVRRSGRCRRALISVASSSGTCPLRRPEAAHPPVSGSAFSVMPAAIATSSSNRSITCSQLRPRRSGFLAS